jgi:hypothetical protein
MPIVEAIDNSSFPPEYHQQLFLIWYEKGKPSVPLLHKIIPEEPLLGKKPTVATLQVWVREDFKPKAEELDTQVEKAIFEKAVTEKIEMLERHTSTAVKMQDIAIKYLEENQDELNPNSATRLLIEGVRIERESRGLPDALRKMSETSDEDLLKQIQEFMNLGSSSLEPLFLEDAEDAIS